MSAPRQPADYFSHSRCEIKSLLPASATRVLEIGCSAGGTLAWLKTLWPAAEFVGIDANPAVLDNLLSIAPRSFIHDLENPLPDIGKFDLVLALDILEHLRNPDRVLENIVKILEPAGRIIVSLPNVAHASVLTDLVFKRQFEYDEAGILDRTHLRFFTERSALKLLRGCGLFVVDGVVNGLEGRKANLANKLTGGLFFHYFVKQYIIAAELADNATRLQWRTTSPRP